MHFNSQKKQSIYFTLRRDLFQLFNSRRGKWIKPCESHWAISSFLSSRTILELSSAQHSPYPKVTFGSWPQYLSQTVHSPKPPPYLASVRLWRDSSVQSCWCIKWGLAHYSQSRLLETSVSSLIIEFISQDATQIWMCCQRMTAVQWYGKISVSRGTCFLRALQS